MTSEIALIFAVVSFIADLALIVAFLANQKKAVEKAAREEGKRDQRMSELENSLERAHAKIRVIDERLLGWITDQAGLAADMKNVLSTTSRIETKLDNHIGGGSAK